MTKKKRTKGRLLAILLAVTAVFAVGAIAPPAHAADGSYTIKGSYVPWANIQEADIPSELKTGTHFTLYRVGSYDWDEDGNSIFKLNPKLAATGLSVDVNSSDLDRDKYAEGEAGTVEWTKEWLNAASGIYDVIKSDPEVSAEATPKEGDSNTDGTFNFTVEKTGLYLLVGDTTKVGQGSLAYYWSPQPMLIQVFDGNTEQREKIGIKPIRERIKAFSIKKIWDNKDLDEDAIKQIQPESVEFIIKYDGKGVTTTDGRIKDGVLTLPDDNGNWFYSWTTAILEGGAEKYEDPQLWSVTENLSEAGKVNYQFEPEQEGIDSESSPQRDYSFTNVYNPQTLEIVKNTPTYLQNSKELASAVVFDITGTDADGNVSYHTRAGMSISGPGESKITVPKIPANITEIKVKELYSAGNYTPKPEGEVKADFMPPTTEKDENGNVTSYTPGKFTVEFENQYNDTTKFDSGIVNKFEKNGNSYTITERQGLGGNSDKK